MENTAQKNNQIYLYSVEQLKIERTLFVKIADIKSSGTDEKQVEIDIPNQIGVIRKIYFSYSKKLQLDLGQLVELITYQIVSTYLSIEQSYIRNSIELNKKFFDRLHDKFNHHLIVNLKEHLCNKYWFVIGHKNSVHYFFNNEKTKQLIEILKSNQINQYSPFELLSSILTTPLPFKESLAIESLKQNREIFKDWSHLDYKETLYKYLIAEKIVYQSGGTSVGLSAYTVCESRDYILSTGMRNEDMRLIVQELKEVKEELKTIFEEGIKEYSIFFRTMRNFQSSISQEELHILLPRMAGEFMSTFIKGMGT